MALRMMEIAGADAKQDSCPQVGFPADTVMRKLVAADVALLARLIEESTDFVAHPEFSKRDIERELFGGEARLTAPMSTHFVEESEPISDAASGGERVPTLSHAQEQRLFMRYNYARSRIHRLLQANNGKRLAAASTRRLIAWGRRALRARSVIVRLNLPLVLAMAKRTRLRNVDFNELVSEGNMALLRSVEKFDSSRGFKFSTYSCRAILKSFSRVAMRMSRYRGTFPTEFDVSMERSDYVESQRMVVEEDCVDELKDILLRNLADLTEVETTVIRERFALGQFDSPCPKTLEQVGLIIGVTKERVRQIQNKALKKMRLALEERYLAA